MKDLDGLCPAQLRFILAKLKNSSAAQNFPTLALQIEEDGQKLLAKAMHAYLYSNCTTATPTPTPKLMERIDLTILNKKKPKSK